MKINIATQGVTLTATLLDNDTAHDFVALLPITLTMDDLFSREKYGRLSAAISEGGGRSFNFEAGHLAYWSPGPDLAIFYQSGGPAVPMPGIIIIGKIDDGLSALDVSGSVEMTLTRAE